MSVGKRAGCSRSVGLFAAFAWLTTGAILVDPALAGSFKVNPVHINLPADRQTASLTISNSDAVPVSVRVIALEWTQVDGSDVHTPTNNVIASPPIFTLPAGKTQLVRIGLKNRDSARAYRVIFEEIPRPEPLEGEIQVNLRLDLPLYVLAEGGGKADLFWRAWRDDVDDLFVEGRNSGALHSQVVELAAWQPGVELRSTQMGVILPGSARRWKIGKAASFKIGLPLRLKVRSQTGEVQTHVTLEQR